MHRVRTGGPRHPHPPAPSMSSRPPPSPLRGPRSRPPRPSAEDEAVSLRKEAGAHQLLESIGGDDIPERGTVDQDPVIIDVPARHNQHERRSVHATPARTSHGIPTPPTSGDEQAWKAWRKPSRPPIAVTVTINTDNGPAPELAPRTASRYAYTKPTRLKKGESYTGCLTPLSATSLGSDDFAAAHGANQPAVDGDDDDRQARHNTSLSGNGTSTAARQPPESSRGSVVDFEAAPIRRQYRDARSMTDAPPSPSPAMTADLPPRTNTTGSTPPSAHTSRPASPSPWTAAGESPRIPRTDMDWSTLLASNAARRSKPPSSLSSEVSAAAAAAAAPCIISQEPSPSSASSSRRTAPRQSLSALPYPEDSGLMGGSITMPDEREHAFYPTKNPPMAPAFERPSHAAFRAASPAPRSSAYPSATWPVRPSLTRACSAADAAPASAVAANPRPRLTASNRTARFANTSQTKKELAALIKKGLPPCPRQDPVAGKHDWYTMTGHGNIDFCPDCVDSLFERTWFRHSFRRSLPRNDHDKVRCAFGSPWIRLAWLLTLQQQRTDLILLQDVADIEETSAPCPGGTESVQHWSALRDPDGLFVRDFHLCSGDVRKIEAILPSLAGMFARLPARASHTKSICAMRTDSTRFPTYLDALVCSHERALRARTAADPMPLIEVVERTSRLRECTRDQVLVNARWHYIPELAPSLTVCEDCFACVVEPEIRRNQAVAKKFHRAARPVSFEAMGCSCQLYSPWMRTVFARAVARDDAKYLARKAQERRTAELRLHDQFRAVMAQARRLSAETGGGGIDEEDERRLNRDLEKISAEWKERWE